MLFCFGLTVICYFYICNNVKYTVLQNNIKITVKRLYLLNMEEMNGRKEKKAITIVIIIVII